MSEIITFAPVSASGEAEFVVPFPYISRTHVKLYINGVEDTAKEWLSDGALKASVSVNSGDICVVKRETPRSALITTLPTTGTLQSDDVNEQSLQAVYVATEAADGLREGLALDEDTLTYWEGAPTGVNRIIKDVVDPSAAQEAATKGWYDQQLIDHAANAATSASNASGSASTASTQSSTAVAQAAAATASATAAAASEATASANASSTTTAATNASDAAAEAEAWANTAEDTEVTYANNGGINDDPSYSALHWAAKAATDEATATAANATAQAIVAASAPTLASQLLGDEEGVAINFATFTVASNDYSGSTIQIRDASLKWYMNTHLSSGTFAADNEYNNYDANHFYRDYGTPQQTVAPMLHPDTLLPMGLAAWNGRQWTSMPAQPGNTTYGASLTNLTRNTSATHGHRMLQRSEPSQYTMGSTAAGSEHYIQQRLGRSGVDPETGRIMSIRIIAKSGTWAPDELTLRMFLDQENAGGGATYEARLNLGAQTVTNISGFSGSRVHTSYYGDWAEYIILVPAMGAENTFAGSWMRLYMSDGGDYTLTGDGSSTFFLNCFALQDGWATGPILAGTVVPTSNLGVVWEYNASGGDWQIYGPMNVDSDVDNMSFWGNFYLSNENYYDHLVNDVNILGWSISGAERMELYFDASDPGNGTGTLKVLVEDSNSTNETWDTGVELTVDDTANGGLGTQLQAVLVHSGNTLTLYYRINQGATTTVSTTLVSATDWVTTTVRPSFIHPESASGAFSGILRYVGYVTRPLGSDEISRYMNFT